MRPALALVLLALAGAPCRADYVFTTFDVPGAAFTTLSAISSNGNLTGAYGDATGTHPFAYIGGNFVTLNYDPSNPLIRTTAAYGVNASGQVVGTYFDLRISSSTPRIFVYDGGAYTSLGVGAPAGINDAGTIAGTYGVRPDAFVTVNGAIVNITPPGAAGADGRAINNNGDVVGTYTDYSFPFPVTHNYLLQGGTYTDFLLSPGDTMRGLNDSGVIVGFVNNHGFILDGGVYSLFDVPGSYSTSIGGITDDGVLVGYYSDATGVHGFIATPTPAPPSLVLLGAGVAMLLARAWRRRGRRG
jgi:hypothetical protein